MARKPLIINVIQIETAEVGSDKRPQDCRYDQLEVTPAYELERVFGARQGS